MWTVSRIRMNALQSGDFSYGRHFSASFGSEFHRNLPRFGCLFRNLLLLGQNDGDCLPRLKIETDTKTDNKRVKNGLIRLT
jgi:hypothetical protein